MTEALKRQPYTLDAFEQMTVDNFRRAEGEITDWKLYYAERLTDETKEFGFQHGPGLLLLSPAYMVPDYAVEDESLQEGMADELGDKLYFAAHLARHIGIPLKRIAANALGKHTDTQYTGIETFSDLQTTVMANAHKISIPNELSYGMLSFINDDQPHIDAPFTKTTLQDNPLFVLMRFTNRLVDSLDPSTRDRAAVEPTVDTTTALGDYVNALTYVAKARLGKNIEDIALATKAKSEHRKKYGKV